MAAERFKRLKKLCLVRCRLFAPFCFCCISRACLIDVTFDVWVQGHNGIGEEGARALCQELIVNSSHLGLSPGSCRQQARWQPQLRAQGDGPHHESLLWHPRMDALDGNRKKKRSSKRRLQAPPPIVLRRFSFPCSRSMAFTPSFLLVWLHAA